MTASNDENTSGGGKTPPCTSLTADALPKAPTHISRGFSHTGVSTRNAPIKPPHWYALRTTYGREKKAYEYITTHGGTAFYPTITTLKDINGKRQSIEESRIPNIFFAYGTEDDIKTFVYDNYNLPFLRFYYKHTHVGNQIEKTPLIVPDSQIRSLKIICEANPASDTIIVPDEVTKFKTGDHVVITEGEFKGVEGIVARYQGQQRVGIVINGLLTAATAYIPKAFLERKEKI